MGDAGILASSAVSTRSMVSLGVLGAVGIALITGLAGIQWVVLALGAVLALVAAVFAPGIPLALFFLIPLYKGAFQPFSPIDLTLLLALLNALQIIPVLMDGRVRHVSLAGLGLWVGMAILVVAGVLYAPDQSVAMSRTVTVWALLFIPILPATIRVGSDERYLRQLLLTFLAAGLLTVGLGLLTLTSAERLTVFDTNTIQTGRAALLVPLLAMMFVPQTRSKLLRLAAVIGSVLAVVVALASGSRGPLIALLIIGAFGLIIAVARSSGRDRRTLLAIAIVAIVSAGIITSGAIDLPAVSTERFSVLGEFVGSSLGADSGAPEGDTSSQARVLLFGFAINLFEENPLIGVGTAGYPVLSPAALGDFEANAYPHNAFLQVAAEHGMVGIAMMGALVVLALTRRLPRRTYGHAVRLLFIFYLLNAMVSGDVFDDRVTWGLMMLILMMDIPPRAVSSDDAQDTTPAASPLAWPGPSPLLSPAHPRPYAVPFQSGTGGHRATSAMLATGMRREVPHHPAFWGPGGRMWEAPKRGRRSKAPGNRPWPRSPLKRLPK